MARWLCLLPAAAAAAVARGGCALAGMGSG